MVYVVRVFVARTANPTKWLCAGRQRGVGYVCFSLVGAPCRSKMTPLEYLDSYMLYFAIGCSVYLFLMLLILACFLRRYSPSRRESLPLPVCSQSMELRQSKTYTLPLPPPGSARSQVLLPHRVHGDRSNRSYSSLTHAQRKRKKILIMRRPDISQMERLATL